MSLDTDQHVEQTWGSHQPFLHAIMEILKPHQVVELGCGKYSTPIIEKYATLIITVEHDQGWAYKIIKSICDHPHHKWIIQPFNGINNSTRRPDMSHAAKSAVDSFYKVLKLPSTDFLFVDTFTCARVPAMIHLTQYAEMVMLHDLEGNSPQHYNFEEIGDVMKGWYRYRFAPEGMVNKIHQVPWTDLFSRRMLDTDKLQPVIDRESEKLWGFSGQLQLINNKGWLND